MRALKISVVVLFVLVFISLGLNWYLISQLMAAQQQARAFVREVKPTVQNALTQTGQELESLQGSSIEFNVEIQEEFPVQIEVPFNETIDVPVQMTIPIEENIETTVMMDPFQSGLEIPVDINVPIDLEVPIDTVIPVAIERTIPISTSVPVELDLPVAIKLSDTDLAQYIEQLRSGLAASGEFIDRAAAEIEE